MKLLVPLLLAALVNAGTYTDAIELGNAKNFVIFAKSGIATVPDSIFVGDLGVSPIATTAMTGFDLEVAAVLTQSVLDMQTAYTNASPRSTKSPRRINLKGGNIGDETLSSGVYTPTTGVDINSDIILRSESDDVFIIQSYRLGV